MPLPIPKTYKRSIPALWIIGFAIVMVLIVGASLYFSTGVGAVVNILLGMFVAGGLWLLWLTPSKAGKVEIGEFILGIFLVLVGCLIGSSPTLNPTLARGWTAIGVNPMLVKPLAAPTQDMWEYKNSKVVPTSSVPHGQMLIVKPSNASNGVLLTEEGYDAKGLHTVEAWLQDRGNGYTSSSVMIHLPAEVTAGGA